MGKRFLSVLVTAALLLTMLSCGVFAADIDTGDNGPAAEETWPDEDSGELAPENPTQQPDDQSAATETTSAYYDDDGYPNTHTNTGNQAFDACCAGLTQNGYRQSNNALVKYNYWFWYTTADFGWCGAFVSWCIDQAGGTGTAAWRNAYVNGYNTSSMSSNAYGCPAYAFGSTAAKMGDIVFVGESGASNHVGLVIGTSNTYIWTIEGNVSNGVGVRRYFKSSGYVTYDGYSSGSRRILFYARPNYSGTDLPFSIAVDDSGNISYVVPDGFIDVDENAWYHDAVDWGVDNALIYGMTDYTFEPNRECTRAMIITFLWRMAGSPEPSYEDYMDYSYYSCFTDVSTDSWYYEAVVWGVVNGYVYGMTDTTFEPNRACTRAQALTFLWRTLDSPSISSENIFEDVPEDAWYYDAVLWGSAEAIAYGMTDTTYEPNRSCTRAQIVTFMHRAYQAYRDEYSYLHD